MSSWSLTVLSLWAAYWSAMFAEVAHLRTIDDGVGALACSRISRGLLAVGVGLMIVAKGG